MNILEHFDHHGRKQDKEHFMNLINVAMIDGKIDISESEMLHKFGKKMGFTDPEIDYLIESSNKSSFMPPHEYFKRFEQVYEIIKVVLADGIVDDAEMRLTTKYAIKSGFQESEIPKLIDILIKGIKDGKDEEDLFEIYKKQRKI